MLDALFMEKLAAAGPADPSEMRSLGHKAVDLYDDGVPLTDAVIQVAKTQELNAEQIQRVAEAANQEAYKRAWDSGGSVRNVTFDGGPADAGKVVEALEAPEPPEQDLSDYGKTPPGKNLELDELAKRIFGTSAPKTAAVRGPTMEEIREDLRGSFTDARQQLMSKVAGLQVDLMQASHRLADETRIAVMDGNSMGKIAAAWYATAPRDDLVDAAMAAVRPVVERDLGSGGFDLSLIKTAGAGHVPDPRHPLIGKYKEFCKVAVALSQVVNGIQALDETAEKQAGAVWNGLKGGYKLMKGAGNLTAKGAEKIGLTGEVSQGVAKALPWVGAAAGANEAYWSDPAVKARMGVAQFTAKRRMKKQQRDMLRQQFQQLGAAGGRGY